MIPCIIFITFYTSRRDVYDVHYAIMGKSLYIIILLYADLYLWPSLHFNRSITPVQRTGILYSVLITAVVTDAIKDAVGRPRPNFFFRCFPDGKQVRLLIIFHD